MHICFVSPRIYYYFPKYQGDRAGGSEKQQYLLSKELLSDGHKITFIVEDGSPVGNYQCCDIKATCPKPEQNLDMYNWARMINSILNTGADLFYVRGLPLYLVITSYTCGLRGKKVIYAVSNDWQVDPNYLSKMNSLFKKAYINSLRKSYVAVQKKRQMELLSNNFNISSSIVPNIYKTSFEDTVSHQNRDIVLWVGRINKKQKKPELFIKLAKSLSGTKFVMIGSRQSGEEDYFTKIKNKANYVPNLHFEGFVKPSEIENYFVNAMMLINTSEFEGFPNTYLEAWGNGTPVVSYNETPHENTSLTDRDQDIIINANSFDELKYSVRNLTDDIEKREMTAKKARNYVQTNHSPEVSYEKFLRCINQQQ